MLLLIPSVMKKRVILVFIYMMITELRQFSALPTWDNPPVTAHNQTGRGSFLWEVQTDPPSYFFGTIHVPFTRVWDAVPLSAKQAFARSDRVYFEVDLNDHSTLSILSACQLLPQGMHISEVISTDLYLRIKIHLEHVKDSMPSWVTQDQLDLGLSPDFLFSTMTANWERKRPIWVILMIASLTKSDVASRGVPVLDLHLSKLASKYRKQVGAVESVEDQCSTFNSINKTMVLFALDEILKEQEDVRLGVSPSHLTVDDMIEHYRRGNLDSVLFNTDTMLFSALNFESGRAANWNDHEREIAKELEKIFHEKLLVKRNQEMVSRIHLLIDKNPSKSFFFAIGAAHFIGKNSILDMMAEIGYNIRQIPAEENLSKSEAFMRGHSHSSSDDASGRNTVQGTFEDLSEEEKTRALLQFLQYHQQQEQESETKRFKEMIQRSQEPELNSVAPAEDERIVEESLKVWYGVSDAAKLARFPRSIFPSMIFVLVSLQLFL